MGHEAEAIQRCLTGRQSLRFALQVPQRGTAHALQQAEPLLAGRTGTLVLLSGDVPLLASATARRLLETHHAAGAAATVLTAVVERPYGYGRVIRAGGRIARIVEERDASPAQRHVREINSGVYAFDMAPLFDALRAITARNVQGECYLTDLIAVYRRRKLPVETLIVEDPREVRGVNTRSELSEVGTIMRQKKNEAKQRVAVRCNLQPLDREHTRAYIEHRMTVAGASNPRVFTPDALPVIHEKSGGVPRLINIIAERSLLVGFVEDSPVVTPAMVESAVDDLRIPTEAETRETEEVQSADPALLMRMAARMESVEGKIDVLVQMLVRAGVIRPELADDPRTHRWLDSLKRSGPEGRDLHR